MSTWPQLLGERQMLLDSGVGALPKVLEAYMGEEALPIDPTQSILGNYSSGCYSVALATQ